MDEQQRTGLVSLSRPWRWLPEFMLITRGRLKTQGKLLGSAVLVGIATGLVAVLFTAACQIVMHYGLDLVAGYRPGGPTYEPRLPWPTETDSPFRVWLLIPVIIVGGLLSGWVVFRYAPEAEGHGTDAAIDAYHNKQGYIRPRVPLIKIIASALTIGTGGSGGREGPIAQTGAGVGSLLARLFRLPPTHHRILLAAGVGAGIAAIFRAPLAGALFAAEVLYSSPEFEAEVIIPAGLASVVSYSTFGLFFGWQPLFATPNLRFAQPLELVPYTVLALSMALMAMLYTRTFYGTTQLFHRLKMPPMLKPALGGLITVLIGLALYFVFGQEQAVLAVLSFGYGILQQGLSQPGTLTAGLLLAVAFGKILTTSLTIGSGGSGGVFGPSMVIGGCSGGALGVLLHQWWPGLVPHPGVYMLLGMAAFFAAAAKTPFSTLVIVSEMHGDYQLLLPALWVCTLAYLLSDEQSLFISQVAGRIWSPAHRGTFVRKILAGMTVGQFMLSKEPIPCVSPNDRLPVVLDRLEKSPYSLLPVVDADHHLLGVVDLEEVHLASRSPHAQSWLLAMDLMLSNIRPLKPYYTLDRALELFAENDLLVLPVVDDDGLKLIGMIHRADVSRNYLRHIHGQVTSGQPTPETR